MLGHATKRVQLHDFPSGPVAQVTLVLCQFITKLQTNTCNFRYLYITSPANTFSQFHSNSGYETRYACFRPQFLSSPDEFCLKHFNIFFRTVLYLRALVFSKAVPSALLMSLEWEL